MLVDMLVEHFSISDRLECVADPRNPRLPDVIQEPHSSQTVQRDLQSGWPEIVSTVTEPVAHIQQPVEDQPRQ
jgi:hypothetical protein